MKKKFRFTKKSVEQLAKTNPEQLIAYCKDQQVLLKPKLWSNIKKWLSTSCELSLNSFIKQADILHSFYVKALKKVQEHDELLKKISWETLIFSYAALLEKTYFDHKRPLYDFEAARVNLLESLQAISKQKHKTGCTWKSYNAFHETVDTCFRRLKKKGRMDTYDAFFAYNQFLQAGYLINRYCLFNWKLEIGSNIRLFPTKKEWSSWQKTTKKYELIHAYYDYLPFVAVPQICADILSNSPNQYSQATLLHAFSGYFFFLDFLGINEVQLGEEDTDIIHALRLMGSFDACYKMRYLPQMEELKIAGYNYVEAIEYGIYDLKRHQLKTGQKDFFKILTGGFPNYCDIRTQDVMLDCMEKENNLITGHIQRKQGVELLNSFSAFPHEKELTNSYFIRTDRNNYILIPRLSAADAKTILFNDLVQGKTYQNKAYSEHLEQHISTLFSTAGYETLHSWEYTIQAKEGEVDVLAYKDNTLFVIEAKFTYFRATLSDIYNHKKVLNKANDQLTRACSAIKEKYQEISKSLNISCEFDKLQIYPLIVSTSPEFEYEFQFPVRKISIFELSLLLTQGHFAIFRRILIMRKYSLIAGEGYSYLDHLKMKKLKHSPIPIDNRQIDLDIEKDIRQNSDRDNNIVVSPQALINALDQRLVWQQIEESQIEPPVMGRLNLGNEDEIYYAM